MISSDESFVDIVFDGPPGHDAGRFVEVEDSEGLSISFGQWVHRDDGHWCLRLPACDTFDPDAVRELLRVAQDETATLHDMHEAVEAVIESEHKS